MQRSTQSALNGVDLVIIGRSLSSSAYANGNADGYNGLEHSGAEFYQLYGPECW